MTTIYAMWHDVRDAAGKLLFRFDPQRDMVEIKTHGGGTVTVALSTYRDEAAPRKPVDIAQKM